MARTPLTTVLAAVLGPLVVWLFAFTVLTRYKDREDAEAAKNAGRIVNAKVLDTTVSVAMDRMLAAREPKVIVLGPSYANTDIKVDLLSANLGISRDDFALLSVPNSVGAHWYAMLKHRVFDAGHRPKLVVVVSGLQSMLLTTPLTESSMVNLEVQLPPEGDPLVDQLVQRNTWLWVARLREQRGKVRQLFFDAARNLPARVVFGVGPDRAELALQRVFDDANVDMALHTSSSMVVSEAAEVDRFYTPEMLPAPDDSFFPHITALVRDHDTQLVWVRPPMSPFIPEHLDDVVLPGVQERAIEIAEARGATFLDMRALPMTSAMFKNEDHMNEEGSRRFSEALGKALLEREVLFPGADPGATGPLVARVEGGIPFAELPPEEQALGDGAWMAPGRPLTVKVPGWTRSRGSWQVEVVTTQREPEPMPRGPVAFTRIPGLGTASYHGLVQGDPPGLQAFDLVFSVPAGGRPVRVDALALGKKLGRIFVIGDAGALAGRSVRTLGVGRIVGGVLVDESIHPTYAKPPVKPPGANRDLVDLPDEVAAYATERWAFLSDEALMGESAFGSRCSPLRITEDGVELGPANVPCGEVKHQGHGRSCHTTDRIFFTAPDGSDPAMNGRTYRLALDPDRVCDTSAWIYPKDQLRLAFPPERVAELLDGVGFLRLRLRYLNQRPADLIVRLRVDGDLVLEERVDGRDVDKAPFDRALPMRLPPGRHEVVLELENTEHVFYLLDEATLFERQPDAG